MDDNLYKNISEFIAVEILKQPGKLIGWDEPLISSGLIDSFSLVDLALYVEDNYSVQIDDTELNADTFDTLEELAALIESKSRN